MATAEQATSLGERVSRIEVGYEHLATKADLAQLKAELKADLARLGGGTTGGYRSIAGPQSNGADLSGDFAALRREIRSLRWWILSWGAACVLLPRLAVFLFGG